MIKVYDHRCGTPREVRSCSLVKAGECFGLTYSYWVNPKNFQIKHLTFSPHIYEERNEERNDNYIEINDIKYKYDNIRKRFGLIQALIEKESIISAIEELP